MKKYLMASLAALMMLSGCGGKKTKDEVIGSNQSCYEKYGLKEQGEHGLHNTFVLIDQTTVFDDKLEQNLLEKIKPLFAVGSSFSLIKFSTFSQEHYTSVVAETYVDKPMPQDQEDDTPIGKVRKFKKCLDQQTQAINTDIPSSISQTLRESNTSIDQSELLKSFQDIASSKIAQSTAHDKILIIASDMLENSSVTSFYANNKVRDINPVLELEKAKKAELLADFKGARVYVIGAGLVVGKNNKRSISAINHLKQFWQMYFEASNAKLEGFGEPELLETISPKD
ncbi:MAG: hypothetical protein PHE73_04685 [Sulfurovaceae bacterium]|nr:hypothetical protein [Sulfurovaceae bacterium]